MSKFVTQVAPALTTVLAAVVLALVSPRLSGGVLVAVWGVWVALAVASVAMIAIDRRMRGGRRG